MALTLETTNKSAKPKRCSLMVLRDNLPAEDQPILDSWIENNETPYKIFRALKQDGHSIGRQTVYEHMNGWCICNGTK